MAGEIAPRSHSPVDAVRREHTEKFGSGRCSEGAWGSHDIVLAAWAGVGSTTGRVYLKNVGSSLFSVGTFSLAQDGPGSDPQMAQIATDVFMSSTHLLNLCLDICGT